MTDATKQNNQRTDKEDFTLSEQDHAHHMRRFYLSDHACLRAVWANKKDLSEGVMRSSQPSPKQLAAYQQQGLKTVVNLRGDSVGNSFYLLEREACAKLGITLISFNVFPGGLPSGAVLKDLLETIKNADKSLLFHCKTGADRTGFIAALCVLQFEHANIQKALAQLHWRHLHLKSRKMGIFDHAIEAYITAFNATGIDLLAWLENGYDPVEIGKSWATISQI